MPLPLPVNCEHINCIKHRTVGAHEAGVSRIRTTEEQAQLHVISYGVLAAFNIKVQELLPQSYQCVEVHFTFHFS